MTIRKTYGDGETFSWKRGESPAKTGDFFFEKETLFGFEYSISYGASSGCSRLILYLEPQHWFTKWCIQIVPFVVPQCFLVKEIPDVCFFRCFIFVQIQDGTKPGTGFHSECLSRIFFDYSPGFLHQLSVNARVQTQSRACVEYTPRISVVAKLALWDGKKTHRLQCFEKRKLDIFSLWTPQAIFEVWGC